MTMPDGRWHALPFGDRGSVGRIPHSTGHRCVPFARSTQPAPRPGEVAGPPQPHRSPPGARCC